MLKYIDFVFGKIMIETLGNCILIKIVIFNCFNFETLPKCKFPSDFVLICNSRDRFGKWDMFNGKKLSNLSDYGIVMNTITY